MENSVWQNQSSFKKGWYGVCRETEIPHVILGHYLLFTDILSSISGSESCIILTSNGK